MTTRFWHFRRFTWHSDDPCARGGVTVCAVTEGIRTRFGVAVCSLKDTYCKATGRILSLRRTGALDGVALVGQVTGHLLMPLVEPMAQCAAEDIYRAKDAMATLALHGKRDAEKGERE